MQISLKTEKSANISICELCMVVPWVFMQHIWTPGPATSLRSLSPKYKQKKVGLWHHRHLCLAYRPCLWCHKHRLPKKNGSWLSVFIFITNSFFFSFFNKLDDKLTEKLLHCRAIFMSYQSNGCVVPFAWGPLWIGVHAGLTVEKPPCWGSGRVDCSKTTLLHYVFTATELRLWLKMAQCWSTSRYLRQATDNDKKRDGMQRVTSLSFTLQGWHSLGRAWSGTCHVCWRSWESAMPLQKWWHCDGHPARSGPVFCSLTGILRLFQNSMLFSCWNSDCSRIICCSLTGILRLFQNSILFTHWNSETASG